MAFLIPKFYELITNELLKTDIKKLSCLGPHRKLNACSAISIVGNLDRENGQSYSCINR